MQLIIDIGNTQAKFALFKEQTFLLIQKGDVNTLIDLIASKNITSAILSAVKPSEDIEEVLNANKIPFLNLSHKTPIPITNKYKTPKTLGDDRLANVIAAYTLYPNTNALTIDCGTCIKYDLITKDGSYFGGAISPGIAMRFKALASQTAQLPEITLEPIDFTTGNSSKQSILSGVLNGATYEMRGFISQYQSLYDNLTVILTGGDAKYFEKVLNCGIFAEPNLTLIGLNEILQFNP